MTRTLWLGGLLALALVAGGAGGATAEAPKLTLAVPGIPPVFQTVLAYVADKQGFFKKYDVDVTVRALATGVAAARAVASG